VMFGEPIPTDVLDKCIMEANRSDCMLVAGTSATVNPAASLPLITRRNGGRLVEVNLYTSQLSQIVDVMIQAPSGEALPVLVEEVQKLL
jgi:NAD-dependent deacetylase